MVGGTGLYVKAVVDGLDVAGYGLIKNFGQDFTIWLKLKVQVFYTMH